MSVMPDVVTHRYDPARGMCLNLCSLSDFDASRVLDRLRRESRPTVKPDYLIRRRRAEDWLSKAASQALGRAFEQLPVYFFLGDFTYLADLSRPEALRIPLANLPVEAITFTLGDSMSVAEQPARTLYRLDEMVRLFDGDDGVAGFGLSDRLGFQACFVEVQLWDRSVLSGRTT